MMNKTAAIISLSVLVGCNNSNDVPKAVGQLESERIELTAEVSEKIISRSVAEGDVVRSGDLLFSQDSRFAETQVEQAEAQVAERKSALDELLEGTRIEQLQAARAETAGAKKEKSFRIAELSRIKDLTERRLASDEELDKAQIALDGAIAALDAASARLRELTKGPREKTIEQAAARLQSAQASLKAQQITLERHQVSAPVDGVLDRYIFEVGEKPKQDQVVAVLLSGSQPYARVYIPADVRTGIHVDDVVNVKVDGKDGALEGRVRWISSEAAYTPYFALTERDRERLSYLAKIDLPATDKRLPDGVPVEIEFSKSSGAKAQ